jgi:hypothetical protein
VLGQLKSFALAAPLRITITPAQMLGRGEYVQAARFLGAMMIGGYLAHSLRQLASGKTPASTPGAAASEALSESGLAGVLPDIVAPIGRRIGIFGESARYSDRNVLAAFGGPAAGALGDSYDFVFNRSADGVSARDLQMLRRLLPFQNVWWLRRAVNALEGETAEALDLKGADHKSFAERYAETTDLKPSRERGGTGTGVLQQ